MRGAAHGRIRVGLATAALAAAILVSPRAQSAEAELQRLFDRRAWLELRAAVNEASPPFFRGAVAAAFNQSAEADALLRSVIRAQPRSDAANQSYALLAAMYLRSGRYRTLSATLVRWRGAFPDRPELRGAVTDVEQFRGLPDQLNSRRGAGSTFKHDDDIFVPVTIQGKAATFFFDTGAWVSVLAGSEARRLGLPVRGSGTIGDSSGRGVKTHRAVADEVILGPLRARHVSFIVVPDREPFSSLPPGRRGIIGIPLLVALERLDWRRAGTVTLGGPAEPAGSLPNLVFDGNHLLARARVLGTDVSLTLDTGAVTTDLNANFADTFAGLVWRHGTRGRHAITGIGGSEEHDAITVPDVWLEIAGRPVHLRPATVTLQRQPGIGGTCCVGNLGLDLLRQGGGFAIDLSRMRLTLD